MLTNAPAACFQRRKRQAALPDQICTRNGCGEVLNKKLGHNPGAEADCPNDQVCTRDNCGVVLAEKPGHDYAAAVTNPTCTKQGYTTYTCSRCKDSYKADQTAALGHRYDLWYPNPDGAHSAEFKPVRVDVTPATKEAERMEFGRTLPLPARMASRPLKRTSQACSFCFRSNNRTTIHGRCRSLALLQQRLRKVFRRNLSCTTP